MLSIVYETSKFTLILTQSNILCYFAFAFFKNKGNTIDSKYGMYNFWNDNKKVTESSVRYYYYPSKQVTRVNCPYFE